MLEFLRGQGRDGDLLRTEPLAFHLASLLIGADLLSGALAFWMFGRDIALAPQGIRAAESGALLWIGLRLACVLGSSWFAARLLRRATSHFFDSLRAQLRKPAYSGLRQPPVDSLVSTMKFVEDLESDIEARFNERTLALASITHDLNAHLARLSLRVQALEDEGPVTSLVHDMTAMAGMLEATLTYLSDSRAEEALGPVNLTTVIDELIADVHLAGGRAHRTGTVDLAHGQPLAVRRCLANLVFNAIKYAGSAEIVLKQDDLSTIIQIVDRGPGIPEADLDRVLRPFYRVRHGAHADTPGFGVGLSVAREVALRHGGNLHLKNRPGGGLIATVTLPLRERRIRRAAPVNARTEHPRYVVGVQHV